MKMCKKYAIISFVMVFFVSSIPMQDALGVGRVDFTVRQHAALARHDAVSYVAGEVLVKFKEDKVNLVKETGFFRRKSLDVIGGIDEKKTIDQSNVMVYKIQNDKSVEEMIDALEKNSAVDYAQPNYIYKEAAVTTDDSGFANQWALENTGQRVGGVSGAADADIDAVGAWSITDGTAHEVTVAVIDSGVAYNHPDLAANMWDGSTCVDPDNNAVSGGCMHGYDTFNDDADPAPDANANALHGTHVAGIIAAVDNSIGILGVNPHAKIMAVRASGHVPGFGYSFTSETLIAAINFARNNGADVINMSLGSGANDTALRNAIDSFSGLVVAAAGNGGDDGVGDDNDATPMYPASFDSDHIISVAATNQDDTLASFSNYGVTTVDIAAPGENIYSTVSEKKDFWEDVQTASVPALPTANTFTSDGNFGTYDSGSGEKVFVGDTNQLPYTNDHTSQLRSSSIDLSAYDADDSVFMDFTVFCDTEYSESGLSDYMELYFSPDGSTYSPAQIDTDGDGVGDAVIGIDEYVTGMLSGNEEENTAGGYWSRFKSLYPIPDDDKTSTFSFGFQWSANATDNNHYGCYIDDILIHGPAGADGDAYLFEDGTSMAAPQVAGLAALLLSFDPTLTTETVKDTLMNTGDALSSLDGNTVSGRRINAQAAVQAVAPSVSYFTVTGNAAQNAGQTQEITITAKDAQGNTFTDYTGDHTITFSGATNAPDGTAPTCNGTNFGTETTLAFTDGVATCDMILYKREGTSIDVSDGTYDSTGAEDRDLDVEVSAGDVSADDTSITVSPDPTQQEQETTITVTAKDQYRNSLASGGETVTVAVTGASTANPSVTDEGDGTYTATYTPQQSGEDAVTAQINGEAVGFDEDGTGDGTYEVEVRAQADITEEDDTIEITKPSMKLSGRIKRALSKKKKVYIPKDKITFKGRVPELAGGSVKIKGKRGSKSEKETVTINSDGTWKEKMKFDKDGTWKVKFTFYNAAGEKVDSLGSYAVKIDTEDPEFVSLPERLSKARGGYVWFDAKDSEKFKKFKVYFNGNVQSVTPEGECKDGNVVRGTFEIPRNIPPGYYDMVVKAYDKAGNSTKRSVRLRVW